MDNFDLLAARFHVSEWLMNERIGWADEKYDEGLREKGVEELRRWAQDDESGLDETLGMGLYWATFVENYLQRIALQGLDTQQGKQALGKLIVTLTSLAEAAKVAFGPFPKPGVSSGTIEEWTHDGDHTRVNLPD